MFKHILVPMDGSALSRKALKQGLMLAKKLKAKVSVVHIAIPFAAVMYGEIGPGWETAEQQMRALALRDGRKHLERARTIARSSGMKINRFLIETVPVWKGIVDTARIKRCDAIFMGAHGHGALSSLLLGSQTNAVLAHSKIPVMVIR